LLLAGDAAHQMPPFAGQGMCSGIRDAANLAWKLDLVLAGKAPETLLDTYATERVPHVGAMINFSMELGKVICVADPAEAGARDAMMIEAAKDGQVVEAPSALGIGPGVTLDGDPHAGELFVQGHVERAGAKGLFDDVVGTGWRLLSPIADPASVLDRDAAAYFASIGGVTAHVGAGGTIRDVGGVYREWFERSGVVLVLQRPDFYVFGTALRVDAANTLVEELRRSLARAPAVAAPPR
jgi:3-(3-hydroxy-phenyl)propionate hydroxylase